MRSDDSGSGILTGWKGSPPHGWQQILAAAYDEDVHTGDLTAALWSPGDRVRWYIEAQTEGILCGCGIAAALLADAGSVEVHIQDGDPVQHGSRVISGEAQAGSLLSRERTALNFLMLLSGTATLTHRFVQAVSGTNASITDTRKTIPGLRRLQKYAVVCGGGKSHRMGLYDAMMLKDNHIARAGSIAEAMRRARSAAGHMVRIEVEVESVTGALEAVEAGADVVMLDNMSLESMAEAVRAIAGRAVVEASGGVTLATVAGIAATGVDVISVGALTHSAPALPLHLELEA